MNVHDKFNMQTECVCKLHCIGVWAYIDDAFAFNSKNARCTCIYLRVSPFAPLVSPFCTSLTYTYEIATLFSPYFKCRHLLCTIYAVIMINILIMNKCERLGESERWCAEDSYTSCRVVNAEVNRPMQHCQQNMYYVCATVVWAEDLKSKMLAIE